MSDVVWIRRNPSRASLASYIHTSVLMLQACSERGLRGYVDLTSGPSTYMDSTRHGQNIWEWFFVQPHISRAEAMGAGRVTWEWERDWKTVCGGAFKALWNATSGEAVLKLQEVAPKLLIVNDEVQKRSESLFQRYGLDPQRTVAVSCRGTDKHTEAYAAPIERYFSAIDEAIVADVGIKVWVQAEEESSTQALLARYPRAVAMSEFFRAKSKGVMADYVNPKRGYEKALDAVTMMHMLSMCGKLLKNASNLSDLAAGLSKGIVTHIG